MKMDQILVVIAAVVVGFIGKIIWDWLVTGRTEKGVYQTVAHCDEHREKCGVSENGKDIVALDTRVTGIEKQMDEGRENFKILRGEISGINKSLAGIKAFLEVTPGKKDQGHD